MMVFFENSLSYLLLSVIVVMHWTGVNGSNLTDDEIISVWNASWPVTSTTNLKNSTDIPSTSRTRETTTASLPSTKKIPAHSFVDQINSYRNTEILSRIKQCDRSMKLNDLCERYSLDNTSNLLVPQSNIPFQTIETLYDSLVNRTVVEKLTRFCHPARWCLANLSRDDIDFTDDIIRERGDAFCALERCRSRLVLFVDTCPTLANTNISAPVLELLPMLCALYNEREEWNSTECIEEIVKLFHLVYAFWPQFERCYDDLLINTHGCSPACAMFDRHFDRIENQCSGHESFSSQIPPLAAYLSAKRQHLCRHKTILQRLPLINSVKQIFSSDIFRHRPKDNSLYFVLLGIVCLCFVFSFALCICSKLQRKRRRFADDYEYTRLQHTSFELGPSTENSTSAGNELIDDEAQSGFGAGRSRLSEHQRLLRVDS